MSDDAAAYKGDLPGSRRSVCLGCGYRVVTARDSHCRFVGKRDGSVLLALDAKPLTAFATDIDRVFEPGLLLLGVAHRDCVSEARRRLEAQQVKLPEDLPRVMADEQAGDLPQLHLPPGADACAFCGSPPTTDEHVWAKWISDELRRNGSFLIQSDHGPRRQPSINITVPVCATCNNRWLSVLENDVRPVLAPLVRGERMRLLSVEDQRLLATWGVKTALLLDLSTGSPVVPAGFFHDFRLRRCPLESHFVWLGAYGGSNRAVWASHRGLQLGASPGEPPLGFVTTFTAFRVIFQVVGQFATGGATIQDDRLWSAGLHQIWPVGNEPIKWPRGRLAFDDDALVELDRTFVG
jgi:hypothetical protein